VIRGEAQETSGLRLVTPKTEFTHYRDLLKSAPVTLNTNHRQRQLELVNRLREGSFQAVCEVMRDLTASGWRRPLSQADSTTLAEDSGQSL
jgi:RNA polymerase-interacting CarD/CdnL/TRCF family regulator